MKMLRFLILVVILGASFSAQCQNVKLKKGEVLVDKELWLKYDGCGAFEGVCSILNLNGEEIIFIKTVTLNGVEPISSYNHTGDIAYYEVSFLGLDKKIELQRTQSKLLAILYKDGVVKDGKLDVEKVDRLVEKYGTEFSDRYKPNNTTQTIIIKEEPKKSGVNINIGG